MPYIRFVIGERWTVLTRGVALEIFSIEEEVLESILCPFSALLMFAQELLDSFCESLLAFSTHYVACQAIVAKVLDFFRIHKEKVVVSVYGTNVRISSQLLLLLNCRSSACKRTHDFPLCYIGRVYREDGCFG